MSRILRISTIMLILLAVPATLSAGIWDNMTYQGVLVDSTGAKVTGTRVLTFSLWDTETDGASFWSEEHTVSVVDGVVDVVLGTTTPLSTLSGLDQYWLQIQVGTDTPMDRIKLTAVPYAFSALNADKLDGYSTGAETGQIPINNSTKNEHLNADMVDGHDVSNAADDIPLSNGAVNTNLNADKLDGYSTGNDEDDIPVNDGALNATLNADMVDGLDADTFSLVGHTHVMADITDLSVGNNAGTAEGTGAAPVDITTSETTIQSAEIDAPAGGMCLVLATVEIELTSTDAAASVMLGIGSSEGSIPAGATFTWAVPDSVAIHGETNTLTVQNLFTVSGAGTQTYYLQALKGEGNTTATATTRRVSAIYFPFDYTPVP